jgi:protein-S-isoprenylcysteine O-methyltransferase Ste14
MVLTLFFTALILEVVNGLLFFLTIERPGFRFWPPPSHRSWQFFLSWFLDLLVAVLFIILGLFDFVSFWLTRFGLRLPVALTACALSSAIGIWVYTVFPYDTTVGPGDRLITAGPYRHSRNPQYIADSLSIFGYMFLTNSWMVWVIGTLGMSLNIIAPFTEETWLEERFAEAYREYKARVPRFFGIGRPGNSA